MEVLTLVNNWFYCYKIYAYFLCVFHIQNNYNKCFVGFLVLDFYNINKGSVLISCGYSRYYYCCYLRDDTFSFQILM